MNIFENMITSDKLEEVGDFSGRTLLDSDLYKGTIKLAYINQSTSSKAVSIVFLFNLNNVEVSQTVWVTNKDGLNYSVGDDGKHKPLPGFNMVNTMIKMYSGSEEAELKHLNQVPKTIKLYDFTAKKEVDTEVITLPDLKDLDVTVIIAKIEENKKKKEANGSFSTLEETIQSNNLEKFLDNETHQTYTEKKKDIAPTWAETWLAKNKGQVISKVKTPANTGSTFPAKGGTSATSLFNKSANTTSTSTGNSLFPKKG